MKALAIVALIFSAISVFIPVGGVYLALLCSVFALASFRAQPTLAGIAFGINIISTAFLSPTLMLAASGVASSRADSSLEGLYFFFVGFHVVLLAAAIGWRVIRGPAVPA